MSAALEIQPTRLAGVWVLERRPMGDERGWLERLYDAAGLTGILGDRRIAQVNRTVTRHRGTVRGLHFQRPPAAETKVVTCLRGSIFDVALDLRRGSPTFLAWHGEVLDASGHRSLVLAEGVAHGLQALSDDVEVLYLHTAAYDPAAEGGVHPQDPRVAIAWPLPVAHLSARDRERPLLDADFDGIQL